MSNIKNIKGTKDILPENSFNIKKLEDYLHMYMRSYGYGEIRTPVFEHTELFTRSIGNETDIVNKEMYSWIDQGGTSLTLRPELTASVVRSFNQHQLGNHSPINRLYYIDYLFRRERPQKGRFRQFSQFGIEALGSNFPEQDAEVISIAYNIYQSLGIKNIELKINTIGASNIRKKYLQDLRSSLHDYSKELSLTDQNRLKHNALRLFDSKDPKCEKILSENAPLIFDYLDESDLDHFKQVLDILDYMKIPYTHDKKLVRGLDYYTQTTFEISTSHLGAQNALCGGGRYDNLVEELGGKSTPAIGFAAGMERLIIVLDSKINSFKPPDVYMILLGDDSLNIGMQLADNLRKNKLIVVCETLRRSMKSQMRDANKLKSRFVLIIGDNEIKNNTAIIKNMTSGEQVSLPFDTILDFSPFSIKKK